MKPTTDPHAGLRPARRLSPESLAGLAFIIVLHALALFWLISQRLQPSPSEVSPLFVNFITPPVVQKTEEAKRPPRLKPHPSEPMAPQPLLAATAPLSPSEFLAPEPAPPAPVAESRPPPSGPVSLGSELALACPGQPPPPYPALSRRLGESGVVLLRVELNENGSVASAKIERSSQFARLDEAALATVRQWRCTAPTRHGQAVRATALQSFSFVFKGN